MNFWASFLLAAQLLRHSCALPYTRQDSCPSTCRRQEGDDGEGHILERARRASPDDGAAPRTRDPFPSFCGGRPGMRSKAQERIIGGLEAERGRFPWQAQLLVIQPGSGDSRPFFECGGTLITEEVVITAGHCIKFPKQPSAYTVVLGKLPSDVNPVCDEQRLKVVRAVVHPDFDAAQLKFDMAILWVRTKYNQTVRFSDLVQPACLPRPDDAGVYAVGELGEVSGWGLTNEQDRTSAAPALRFVSVPIVDGAACAAAYAQLVNMDVEVQFCAGNDKGQDACAGDSGGPYVKEMKGKHTLVGVVSFGRGCGRSDFPGVYTKVQAFLSWINAELTGVVTADASTKTIKATVAATTTKATTTTTATTTTASTTAATAAAAAALGASATKGAVDLPTTTVEGPICPGAFKFLSCPAGQLLNLVSVFYGRTDSRFCSGQDPGPAPCVLQGAEGFLRQQCHGRQGCWIYHSLFYVDPCPGMEKYIFITHSCNRV